MKENTMRALSAALRWSMEALSLIALLIIVTLPYTLKSYFYWYFGGDEVFYNFILCMLVLCGVFALIILRQLVTIFREINNKNPFTPKNAACLRNISLCCFGIAVLFFIKCLFYLTFLTAAMTLAFIICGFCAMVFSALFRQAVDYKSENDLTI